MGAGLLDVHERVAAPGEKRKPGARACEWGRGNSVSPWSPILASYPTQPAGGVFDASTHLPFVITWLTLISHFVTSPSIGDSHTLTSLSSPGESVFLALNE
jgi:hypothetical protein